MQFLETGSNSAVQNPCVKNVYINAHCFSVISSDKNLSWVQKRAPEAVACLLAIALRNIENEVKISDMTLYKLALKIKILL